MINSASLRNHLITLLASSMVVACILWNLEAPIRLGFAVLPQQYMAFQLGMALTIAYLKFNFRGEEKQTIGWFHGTVAAIIFAVLMYAALDFVWLLQEQAYRPWQITLIGAVVTLGVVEGIRRRTGWMLFAIVLVFMVYSLFADKVPGQLIGKALTIERMVQYIGFDPNAVFSTPLAVGTIIVMLFVFFGKLLFAAGVGTSLPILPWQPPVDHGVAVPKSRLSGRHCSDRFRAVRYRTSSPPGW